MPPWCRCRRTPANQRLRERCDNQVGAFNGNRGLDHTAFTRQLSFRALQRVKNGPSQVRAVAEYALMDGIIVCMNLFVREEGLFALLVACRNLLHLPLLPLQVLPLMIVSFLGMFNFLGQGDEPSGAVYSWTFWHILYSFPCYLIYLCFCGCSTTVSYLSEVVDYSDMDNYIQTIKLTDPSIWMHVKCWHLETRTVGRGRQHSVQVSPTVSSWTSI